MNIDFTNHPGFSAYVLLLMFSGLAMVLIGSPVVKRQRPIYRLLNVLFGVGFFGYGFYLAFLFDGGSYVIFFKAFILPVVLIARSFAGRRPAPAPAVQVPVASAYGSPQPGYPAPATPQPSYGPPAVEQWSAPPSDPR